LLRNTSVASVTMGYGIPGGQHAGDGIKMPGNETKEFSINMYLVDHDFIKTFGMELIAGRDFSRDFATDTSQAFIMNETAVKKIGFGTPENAIGSVAGRFEIR
jgi:putative ABC transport system permease protein